MDLILETNGSLEKAVGQDELSEQESLAIRFLRLSSWMMILGTVRLVAALGDYGSSFLDISPSWHPAWGVITGFLHENPPAVLLGSAWPLILGLSLRKSGGRELLVAGAVTFVILSLGGFLNLLAAMYLRSGDSMVSIGSFTLTRASLLHFNLAAAIRTLMGAVQLTLELATAVAAWALSQSLRSGPASNSAAAGESRRGLFGRLAIYISLAFLVLIVRQPVWTAYIAVLNQSNLIRQFVLRNDVRDSHSHLSGLLATRGTRTDGDFELSLSTAFHLAASNRVLDAKNAYLRIITMAESIGHGTENGGSGKHLQALALNNLAWLLTTCENVHFREPEQALSYARKAVELEGDQGTYWNTLGVAYYRVQDWDEATKALDRSMALRADGEGDSYDWFFLAMIHASKNQKEEGRQWYDRAVTWYRKTQQGDRELYRFQVEAAEALGIPRPSAPLVAGQPKAGGSDANQLAIPHPLTLRRRPGLIPNVAPGDGTTPE